MATPRSATAILVLGDVVQDHHLYEGDGARPGFLGHRGVRMYSEQGGAKTLACLLKAIEGNDSDLNWSVAYADAAEGAGEASSAYAVWRPVASAPDDQRRVWRARLMGYDDGAERPARSTRSEDPSSGPSATLKAHCPDVLVIHDANLGFRTQAHLEPWLGGLPARPRHIILRMSAPLARGDLWQTLTLAPYVDHVTCIVSAEDLRQSQSAISEGLSWERTVTDLQTALRKDPVLAELARCRRLVVCFAQDGVLAIERGEERTTARLLFDPRRVEGQFSADRDGDVTGHLTCMTAAMTLWAARPASGGDLPSCLHGGLSAMRDLMSFGHGLVGRGQAQPQGFPAGRIATVLVAAAKRPMGMAGAAAAGISDIDIRPKPQAPRSWSSFTEGHLLWSDQSPLASGWTILSSSQAPPGAAGAGSVVGLAHILVRRGLKPVLDHQPHVAFGDLRALDWREIESLRGIRRAMLRYRADLKPSRPLSIGVFGPPGAGKSFGVKEIAKEVFGKAGWLEFNLSQFEQPDELKGPFHQVRDLVLSGITPVVFWDEFDSEKLKWLRYLIGPMQDGRFQEKQLSHAIGKAVFVFAGGTCPTFARFDRSADPDEQDFRDRKGPDFVSRLDAYLDVIGPNPREGGGDHTAAIRRAQIIRHHLSVVPDAPVDIDPDLLNALLLVPKYRHGSRSLEKLVKALRGDGTRPIRISALPPPETLDLLVDRGAFAAILGRNTAFRNDAAIIDAIAASIHDVYRSHMRDLDQTIDAYIDHDFDDLRIGEKEDNRAAARRTVDVLALVGMGIFPLEGGSAIDEATFKDHASLHIERLAEAEHDGWMAQRLANGWSQGEERDYDRRLHPGIRPYADLPETDRAKDRMAVMSYWERVRMVGLRIAWLEPQTHHRSF